MLSQYQVVSRIEEENQATVQTLQRQYGCRVYGILLEAVKLCFGQNPYTMLSEQQCQHIAQVTSENEDIISDILNKIGFDNINKTISERKITLKTKRMVGRKGGLANVQDNENNSEIAQKTPLDIYSSEFIQMVYPFFIGDDVVKDVLQRFRKYRPGYTKTKKSDLEIFKIFWTNELAQPKHADFVFVKTMSGCGATMRKHKNDLQPSDRLITARV